MKLYLKNGFADMRNIISIDVPFVLCIGGRGTGKTYGAFEWLVESGEKFVYLRRTAAQQEFVQRPEFSPLKPVADAHGWNYTTAPINKYVAGYYAAEKTDNGLKPIGEPVGYILALSTISRARSFDMSDVTIILYDECIPERQEHRITSEVDAIYNMYETINRNRELQGKLPCKLVMLANANDMDAPILKAFNALPTIERMRRKHQSVSINKSTGLAVVLLSDSPISGAKAQTALYKVSADTGFTDMALSNDFEREYYTNVKSCPIAEYYPYCKIGEMVVNVHKSRNEYYVTTTCIGTPKKVYDNNSTGRALYRKENAAIWDYYLKGIVFFNSVTVKAFFRGVYLIG